MTPFPNAESDGIIRIYSSQKEALVPRSHARCGSQDPWSDELVAWHQDLGNASAELLEPSHSTTVWIVSRLIVGFCTDVASVCCPESMLGLLSAASDVASRADLRAAISVSDLSVMVWICGISIFLQELISILVVRSGNLTIIPT